MSSTDVQYTAGASVWDGGTSPYAIGSKKLGMWLFIIADALTFASLLITYSYLRTATDNWPRPFHAWPSITMATVMTFCLLSSSVTMVFGVAAAARNERKRSAMWIVFTILGGLAFVVLHLNEWRGLIEEGVTPFNNPWGVPLFGAAFFTLTGLHMTHVIIGCLYLSVIAFAFGRGKFSAEDVEVSGLYWHFVDLVWMFIFPMVYLLSNSMVGAH
ncbi:MAG TPA: cytochrome c oxidase subunit 3 [Acidobacteriota bacterium]|jgi:cytochrome c oxidase subunit 3|nr:cytochrome c oxidase subunit 3 [Acidobacteriota bacterium]